MRFFRVFREFFFIVFAFFFRFHRCFFQSFCQKLLEKWFVLVPRFSTSQSCGASVDTHAIRNLLQIYLKFPKYLKFIHFQFFPKNFSNFPSNIFTDSHFIFPASKSSIYRAQIFLLFDRYSSSNIKSCTNKSNCFLLPPSSKTIFNCFSSLVA